MKAKKQEQGRLFAILGNIVKRNQAYGFREIFLAPYFQEEHTTRVRHYDNECEAAELMVHLLKTTLQKQQLQSFMAIKSRASRRFRRGTTPRHNSCSNSSCKFDFKQAQKSASSGWQRTCSTSKKSAKTQQYEFNEVFSKVKMLANSIPEMENPKILLGKVDQNRITARNQIMINIEQLEANMRVLLENNQQHERKRMAKDREKFRRIRISKFQVFI